MPSRLPMWIWHVLFPVANTPVAEDCSKLGKALLVNNFLLNVTDIVFLWASICRVRFHYDNPDIFDILIAISTLQRGGICKAEYFHFHCCWMIWRTVVPTHRSRRKQSWTLPYERIGTAEETAGEMNELANPCNSKFLSVTANWANVTCWARRTVVMIVNHVCGSNTLVS
jgi:hypothetical protein